MDARVEQEPRSRIIALPSRGGDMAALEFGPQDRPIDIVFSHANGFNARTYRTILAPLAAELRILALDLRGHGATTLPAEPAAWSGWPGFAADLEALLEAASRDPVVLAGHSLGATTSLFAAARSPSRVRSLVLFEPVLLDSGGRTRSGDLLTQGALRRREVFSDSAEAFAAYRGRGVFGAWSDAQLADYLADGLRETADGQMTLACRREWEAATYATQGYDAWKVLAEVSCPARIFVGEIDSTVGARAREFAGDGVRLEVIPGASHFLPLERPELVRAALRDAAR